MGKCEVHKDSKKHLEIVFKDDEIGGDKLQLAKFQFQFQVQSTDVLWHVKFVIKDEVKCPKLLLLTLLQSLPIAQPNDSSWTFLLLPRFKT